MSRTALLIAAVAVVLLSAFVAPVAAAPLNGGDVVSVRSEGWLESGAGSPALQAPIQPAGDCEGGGGGGCPAVG